MADSAAQIIDADLTWTGSAFEQGVRVQVDVNGVIEAVGEVDAQPTKRLTGCALLPGFVNAHSHAFQRGLRGRGERFPSGMGNFWSWREAMYELVKSMDEQSAYELSLRAFAEMRLAGITTVGEFHYLHHDSTQQGYAFDKVVLRAAADAGMRIVLLNTYYATGGIGEPLKGGQLRFQTRSVSEYWQQFDSLKELLDSRTQSLGVVAHSIRAARLEDIVALHEESQKRSLVFHMHVEEQPAEIEACVRHHHATPLALLNKHLQISHRFTAVHCTHSAGTDLSEYLQSGGCVCLCPLTEANLGDGIPSLARARDYAGQFCLGTDSNARISMLEEMRWLEYGQRLATGTRGALRDQDGSYAHRLLNAATINGARSLGVRTGAIRAGYHADFVCIDLSHPQLTRWNQGTLAESIVTGCDNGVIQQTCVGGRWLDRPEAERL